jgi:hypothetical protein
MATLEQLVEAFGPEVGTKHFRYLHNKHRGGVNNAKGNNFENFFAVYKIALLLDSKSSESETLISGQTTRFIDDLLIENEFSKKYFQIKDVQSIAWTKQGHSLKKDCEIQFRLGSQEKCSTECSIVLSRKEAYQGLLDSLPEDLHPKPQIIHFSTAETINALLKTNSDFKNVITRICAIKNPNLDKLEVVATILLGVWDASSKTNVRIADFYQGCIHLNPNYIVGSEHVLPLDVESILTSIPGVFFRSSKFVYKLDL